MAIDYARWIRDELERQAPIKSQSGLARHLNQHRSLVSKMVLGQRHIRAEEAHAISVYLGVPIPGTVAKPPACATVAGRIGRGVWYEVGMQAGSTRRVSPVLDDRWPVAGQVAYEVDGQPFNIALAVSGTGIAGDLVVVRRTRHGLESLTLARMAANGKMSSAYDDAVVDGTVVAVVIETRATR